MQKRENFKYVAVLLLVIFCLFLTGCTAGNREEPIVGFSSPYDLLVYPMSGLMWVLGKVLGGNYGLVIIFATIIVRSCAWPIYAKTNDMTLKMTLMNPELAKIQAKYAGREDEESKQRMQMETMQLYKKYGVGIGGCLMPFIQFPIFIAFYTTLNRIPATLSPALKYNYSHLTGNFCGFNLFLPRGSALDQLYADGTSSNPLLNGLSKTDFEVLSKAQNIGIIVLAVLVGLTQIAIQLHAQLQQKKQKEAQFEGIPEYRRPQQTDQQKQTQMTMNIMMYSMSIMMVVFVLQTPAALGLYWLIGNVYSGLQSFISKKLSGKRLEKLKSKF